MGEDEEVAWACQSCHANTLPMAIKWPTFSQGGTVSELAPWGFRKGPLQAPHHPDRLGGQVQLPEATQVTGLTVLLQGWLEHRDGNTEVQVWVGGPRVIVPSVAGNDACGGDSNESMKQ